MAGYGGYDPYSVVPAVDPYGASMSYVAPYAAYAAPPVDDIRTIFITGFPADVKERELNNLMRFLPGYEASQMNYKNGLAQGFALFTTGHHARAACDSITGLCFDDTAVLRCEMARKNMFIRDDAAAPVAAPVPGLSAPKRPRTDAPAAGGAPLMPLPGGYGAPLQPQGYAPVTNVGDNPPCNTLFIGNLSDTVDEGELRGLFAHQPGFVQMKLVRGQRNTSAFVEFMDTETARLVHASQQGALLTTSGRGGIRIQFSKNPYGKKRDAGGQWVDSVPARPGGGGGDGVPAAGADGVQ